MIAYINTITFNLNMVNISLRHKVNDYKFVMQIMGDTEREVYNTPLIFV